jgi:hypothetical protein
MKQQPQLDPAVSAQRSVVESRDDGRVTVRFDNGQLLMGRDPKAFERVGEMGLTAKGKL